MQAQKNFYGDGNYKLAKKFLVTIDNYFFKRINKLILTCSFKNRSKVEKGSKV